MASTEYEDPIPRIAGKQIKHARLGDRSVALRILENFSTYVRARREIPRPYLIYLARAFNYIQLGKTADQALNLARPKHRVSTQEKRLLDWALQEEVTKKMTSMSAKEAFRVVAREWTTAGSGRQVTAAVVEHAFRKVRRKK